MKKILRSGVISAVFGSLCLAFVLGGGFVGADQAVYDPSADLFKILLYLGGGFLVLGLLLITAATLTLRK